MRQQGKTIWVVIVGLALLMPIGSKTLASGWEQYESKTYGFRMLIPEYTTLAERKHPTGWGELSASYLGTEILVYVKLGKPATVDDIEMFTWRLTRIAPDDWQVIDQGKNARGFKWYKTTQSYIRDKVAYGIYGVGFRGNYMLLLLTDPADFEENKEDYRKWYESIEVFYMPY